MDKRDIFTLLVVAYMLSAPVSAARILFYEVDAGEYSMLTGYKAFADELKKKHEIASIEKGGVTKDKLDKYDILIIPNSKRQMSSEEISSIIWFVLQEGKALFITNAEPSSNQLTIPFGTTIDSGLLIDSTDTIPGMDRYNFIVSEFPDHQASNTIRRGVTKIGFYKGNGMDVSGNSKCIARTSADTYSDTGSFPAGSRPCVASASMFGSGLVVILNNGKLLNKDNINNYNNKQFGMNIIEWLSLARESIGEENNTQVLHLTIKGMRLENIKLQQDLDQLTAEKTEALGQIRDLSEQLLSTKTELDELNEGMIGPFNRQNWAIIILGMCLLVGSIVYSQKKSAGQAEIKDEDILEELGYELDGAKDQKKDDKAVDELDKL